MEEYMSKNKAMEAVNQFICIMMDYMRESKKPNEGIQMRDLRILFYIDEAHHNQKVTISDLAYHLKITPAAASQIISGYEKKGWVERIRSKQDRRTVYIDITERLKNRFKEEWFKMHQVISEDLEHFTQDELEHFADVLNAIDGSLREYYNI